MSETGTGMTDQAKKAKAEYYREWRRRNPTKNTEYCNRYWDKRSRKLNSDLKAPNGETETGNGD